MSSTTRVWLKRTQRENKVPSTCSVAGRRCQGLGWQAQSLDVWQIQKERFRLLDPKKFHALLFKVKLQMKLDRAGSDVSCLVTSSHMALNGSKNFRERANALRALQQGALKSSTSLEGAWCVPCGCEATLHTCQMHVGSTWKCKVCGRVHKPRSRKTATGILAALLGC